jgi:NAD(P)-dependent dehydrogenase (short-subunit alcohol dehydrogenase family)
MDDGRTEKPEVVVITGGSAGVGRATAKLFGSRGARVGLLARGQEGLDAACAEVKQAGGEALAVSTDVARFEEIEAAAQRIESAFGPIDIWINNAMTTVFSPFIEIKPEEFKRATEVTYLGTVHGTLAALRRMLPRNHGCIVQVGSALAYRSIPLQAPYCGAKHAIRGFTDSVRSELIHSGSKVHLTMVQLPAINTPQFSWCKTRLPRHPQPVPPIYQPEVAARAIVWAAFHKRREIYLGGSTVKAIVGNKLAPGLLDDYLAHHGYGSQQTDEPVDPDRPDNLFEPVAAHHTVHGAFDKTARDLSVEFWLTRHRFGLALAGLATTALAVWVAGRNGRRLKQSG